MHLGDCLKWGDVLNGERWRWKNMGVAPQGVKVAPQLVKIAPHSLKIAHQTAKVAPSSMDRKSMLHAISELELDSCLK